MRANLRRRIWEHIWDEYKGESEANLRANLRLIWGQSEGKSDMNLWANLRQIWGWIWGQIWGKYNGESKARIVDASPRPSDLTIKSEANLRAESEAIMTCLESEDMNCESWTSMRLQLVFNLILTCKGNVCISHTLRATDKNQVN